MACLGGSAGLGSVQGFRILRCLHWGLRTRKFPKLELCSCHMWSETCSLVLEENPNTPNSDERSPFGMCRGFALLQVKFKLEANVCTLCRVYSWQWHATPSFNDSCTSACLTESCTEIPPQQPRTTYTHKAVKQQRSLRSQPRSRVAGLLWSR